MKSQSNLFVSIPFEYFDLICIQYLQTSHRLPTCEKCTALNVTLYLLYTVDRQYSHM